MTKSNLIQRLSRELGTSQTQSGKFVNSLFEMITRALESGEEVRITGFGTFRSAETKARAGRNPRTGAEIKIPAGKRVSFTAGAGLADAIRGRRSDGQVA